MGTLLFVVVVCCDYIIIALLTSAIDEKGKRPLISIMYAKLYRGLPGLLPGEGKLYSGIKPLQIGSAACDKDGHVLPSAA